MPVQWMEEVLPFSGDIEISQAHEGQIPQVSVRLSHGEIEVKPDAEGQMRELDVDVVLELDIRLYEEKEETLIRDCLLYTSKGLSGIGSASSSPTRATVTGSFLLPFRYAFAPVIASPFSTERPNFFI